MNYFSMFGLSEEFALNQDELKKRYRALQSVTHPDRYASASDQEKRMYMQKNAQINDAYRVLHNQITRGEHMLQLRGTDLPGEQETIGDAAFLMQQMELREDLASAHTEAEFDALKHTVTEMTTGYIERISTLLNENDTASNHSAGVELNKLKFLQKLATEAKSRQQTILNKEG